MNVLGIDTSGSSASAAVLTGSSLGVAVATRPRAHAAVLPDLIEQAARDAGTTLDRITHVAVARGPGMFTGMRVGLVAAQVFAMARGLDLAGVSTLRACANRVIERYRPASDFAVAVDARRKEVFVQEFTPSGEPLGTPRALSTAGVAAGTSLGGCFVDAAIADTVGAGTPLDVTGLAADVATVAEARWKAGAPAEAATPIYVRRPDTTAANPARSVLGQP